MTTIGPSECISALLISQPGLKRDSLCSLIGAIPFVTMQSIDEQFIIGENFPGDCPDKCAILDCSEAAPAFRVLSWIDQLKKRHPQIRCLVISASSKHNEIYLSAGADLALVSGFSYQELYLALQSMFNLPSYYKTRPLVEK
jgi:hypothetical protein